MKIEVRELMDENEMLSHIFLGCIPREQLIIIKDKFIGTSGNEIDWQVESCKIPVEMKIGGVSVNPKEFFNSWKNQMQDLILAEAKKVVAENGSKKMLELQYKLQDLQNVVESWEGEINWNVNNPLLESE